jgi:hypothetical protein
MNKPNKKNQLNKLGSNHQKVKPDLFNWPETVSLTVFERRKLRKFADKHYGHSVWVCYGPGGGIGTTIHASCTTCKKFKNVTDYASW